MTLQEYIDQVRGLVHDQQIQDWSNAELTALINNARKRVALDLHCVRRFYTGINLITNQEIYPIYGGVAGVAITNGGTGYPAVPTVTIAAPASGVTATATAVATGGVITSVTMTNWGSGYTSVPSATFGGGGVNAAGTATALLEVLDILSISVLYPGAVNRYMMSWQPFTVFQAFFRMSPVQGGNPGIWTTHEETNQLFVRPVPSQVYTIEMDAVIKPSPLVNLTDSDAQILEPNADCVQFYASYLALSKLQNFEQADYWRKQYKIRRDEVQHTKHDRRVPNIYRNAFRRANRA